MNLLREAHATKGSGLIIVKCWQNANAIITGPQILQEGRNLFTESMLFTMHLHSGL